MNTTCTVHGDGYVSYIGYRDTDPDADHAAKRTWWVGGSIANAAARNELHWKIACWLLPFLERGGLGGLSAGRERRELCGLWGGGVGRFRLVGGRLVSGHCAVCTRV